MAIRIITFDKAINYGAVLQTYALYNKLKRLDSNTFVIDYENCYIKDAFTVKRPPVRLGIGKFLDDLFYAIQLFFKKAKFKRFRKRNLRYNEDKYDSKSKYITGSDQVWNYRLTDFDKAYFLDFVQDNSKKYSYAASFGFDVIPDEYLEEYKKLLMDFNRISVRENQGAAIIKKLTGKDVPVLLDPTFLKNKNEWLKMIKYKSYSKKYILMYLMVESKTIIEFAKKLSEEKGLELLYICDARNKSIKFAKYLRRVGPEEWINLFLDAEFIITNSFHGIAFSINFNKLFFTELLPEKFKVNSRIKNILDLFKLRDREIVNGKNNNVDKSIDYNKVNEILEKEKQKSIEYLKSIVEESDE